MHSNRSRRRVRVAAVVSACALCLAGGCGTPPRGVLDDLARAYRTATTYADDARMTVQITRDGRMTQRTVPLRVAFARPDRIRVEAYDARIVGAADTLQAAVGGVPGQVLSRSLSGQIDLDQLFADDVLRSTLTEGEAGCPVQLPLLLADDTIDLVLGDATAAVRIAGEATIDDRPCTRLEIPKPDGLLELWIDREARVLRRMRVPTDAYAALLSRRSGTPTRVSVVVDFVDAALNADVPGAAFEFQAPEGSDRVDRLEPLRAPAPPSPLLGRRPERFLLTDLDGRAVSPESLQGRPTVLEFFFDGCTPCNRTMPAVARGIADYAAIPAADGAVRPAPRHLAVSVDGTDVSTADLRRKLAEFGGVGEIVRDPDGLAAQALAEGMFPATVILAADGTVADVIRGEHAAIAADVAESLSALAEDRPTATLVGARHDARLRDYRQRLARAAAGSAGRKPEQVIAPRRQPVRFKLRRLWRAAEVGLPGNLVCLDPVHGSAATRVVALDGWRRVVELDATGAVIARHELALPRDAAVGFLRTIVDGAGDRWWLGAARGGQRVFVFDDSWRLQTACPESGSGSEGIAAACLHHLDDDGRPEIVVARAAAGGLEALTLDGRRLWRADDVGAVRDLAADGAAGLVCIDGQGRPARVAPDGTVNRPPGESARGLRALFTGPVASGGGWAAVAIADAGADTTRAVGIDPAWGEAWTLPLAEGMHGDGPIEPVAWADLLGTLRRQWLIAAPDGSVTVAWADGSVVDRYQHGKPLVGIGGFRHEGAGHVVIATREALECYRVEDVALD